MDTSRHPWALVIFACRESLPQLRETLAAARGAASACAVLHVLVNGNPALANALAAELNRQPASSANNHIEPTIKVWSIALGDKANAWNQYIHQLWAGETLAFFIDGYVRLNPDAIELLGSAVTNNTLALGGTGVPTMGRSAKALRDNLINKIGYHGNFCCIKGGTIRQMRDRHIRLPVGLYRTDSLMGALLSYALDPGSHIWEDDRIHVHPQATWQIDVAHWWRMKDLQSYIKRYLRQARGTLEKAAFADHLVNRLRSPATLPGTAQELVLDWVARCTADYQRLAKAHWLVPRALQSFQQSAPGAGSPEPQLIWCQGVGVIPGIDPGSMTYGSHGCHGGARES